MGGCPTCQSQGSTEAAEGFVDLERFLFGVRARGLPALVPSKAAHRIGVWNLSPGTFPLWASVSPAPKCDGVELLAGQGSGVHFEAWQDLLLAESLSSPISAFVN